MVSTTRPDLSEIVESDVLNAGISDEDRRSLAQQLSSVEISSEGERAGERTPVLVGDSCVEDVGLDDFGEIRARGGNHAPSLSHAVAPQRPVPDNPSFSRNP